jgi:hypothetical protein
MSLSPSSHTTLVPTGFVVTERGEVPALVFVAAPRDRDVALAEGVERRYSVDAGGVEGFPPTIATGAQFYGACVLEVLTGNRADQPFTNVSIFHARQDGELGAAA